MNYDNIVNSIKFFLNDHKSGVLLLKGKWGVGKTYLWNKILKENTIKIKATEYSYVSLFGIENLEQLKSTIVQLSKDIDNEEKKNFFSKEVNKKGIINKSFNLLRKINEQRSKYKFFESYSPYINTILFNNIENMLICFDDIERKSNKLDINDFLGLLLNLKEEKNCKIIIIFNEDALDSSTKEAILKHKEKIFDYELSFYPSINFNISLIYSNDTYTKAIEYSKLLGIENIRILSKTKNMIDSIVLNRSNLSEYTKKQLIHSIVLFCYCYYTKGEDIPDLNFIKNYNLFDNIGNNNLRSKLLNEYNFFTTNKIDLILISFLENGFLNEDDFSIELDLLNLDSEKIELNNQLEVIYSKFRGSFQNNGEEIKLELIQYLEKNYLKLELGNLSGIMNSLENYFEYSNFDHILSDYFQKKEEFIRKEFIDNEYIRGLSKFNQKIIDKLNSLKIIAHNITLNGIFNRYKLNKSFNIKDLEILDRIVTKEEVAIFLNNTESDMLFYFIEEIIKFLKNPSLSEGLLYRFIIDELNIIKEKNKLNKLRIEKFFNYQ